MKSILSSMVIVAMFLTSCQQESLLDASLASDTQSLLENSLNSEISEVYEMNTTGDPLAEGRKKHRRDSLCKRVPVEDLPLEVSNYVEATYPGAKLIRACIVGSGNFIVVAKLSDGDFKLLEFGPDGSFIKELEPRKKGPKGKRKHLIPTDPTSLPGNLTDYLDVNYSGYVIKRAGTTKSGEYVIAIEWNGEIKALLFDNQGNFVKELK
ncbi:MAG: hypothetical protein IPM34_06000 [Saprospiraceae bacterium]|nr:hypothetical protein [Saprospiraceae bacterium]